MARTRRSLLKGVGAMVLGGTAVSALQTDVVSAVQNQPDGSTGVAFAVGISESQGLQGFSDVVKVTGSRDPSDPAADEAAGDDVVHVTSLADQPGQSGDGMDDAATHDYGVSLVNLQDQEYTVSDLADEGLSYDWWVTEDDVTGFGTDNERSGRGPDEVWLFLRDPDDSASDDALGGMLSGLLTPVFRTLYVDEGTAEWHTRTVSDEFDPDGRPWHEVSVGDRSFGAVEDGLVEAYGDATVAWAGIGRGDPVSGPSVLDTYYRDLQVAGETYDFPTADDLPGRGRGRGGGNGGQGNGDGGQGDGGQGNGGQEE